MKSLAQNNNLVLDKISQGVIIGGVEYSGVAQSVEQLTVNHTTISQYNTDLNDNKDVCLSFINNNQLAYLSVNPCLFLSQRGDASNGLVVSPKNLVAFNYSLYLNAPCCSLGDSNRGFVKVMKCPECECQMPVGGTCKWCGYEDE